MPLTRYFWALAFRSASSKPVSVSGAFASFAIATAFSHPPLASTSLSSRTPVMVISRGKPGFPPLVEMNFSCFSQFTCARKVFVFISPTQDLGSVVSGAETTRVVKFGSSARGLIWHQGRDAGRFLRFRQRWGRARGQVVHMRSEDRRLGGLLGRR